MTTKEKTKELLEELSEGIKRIQSSEDFKAVLDFMASFHSYSWRNTLLIHLQCPAASKVAGYRTWQKFGRQVMKGEKGISILAPRIYKKRENEVDPQKGEEVEAEVPVTYFVPVHVFDVSQTEGENLPNIAYEAIGNTHEDVLEKLLSLAKENAIEVSFDELANCEGLSSGGKVIVRKDKNATEQALILIHELAHELLHWNPETRPKLTREQKEMEAEATAYIVAKALGIPETNSEKYLALYKRSYDLEESLEAIHETSQKILQATLEKACMEAA